MVQRHIITAIHNHPKKSTVRTEAKVQQKQMSSKNTQYELLQPKKKKYIYIYVTFVFYTCPRVPSQK